MDNFWEGKTPCWELRECPNQVCAKCLARLNPEKPCWDIDGTMCDKILGSEKSCPICKVYLLYHGELEKK